MAEQRRTTDVVGDVRMQKGGSGGDKKPEGEDLPEIPGVRQSDLLPYVGLRYVSKLFRVIAVILLLLLVAEVITGIATQGSASLPTLLGEASRLIVLAGALWGVGDLAVLMVDVGHDIRATRVYLQRSIRERGAPSATERGGPSVTTKTA